METNISVQDPKFQKHNSGNSFVEFLTVTITYRWFLFWFVFLITVGSLTYALLSPKWYKATASVLPAEKSDFLSAFSGLSALAKNFSPSKGLAALTGNTEFDRYIAILKSSTMVDDVISNFDLRKEYDLEDVEYEKVTKMFSSNLELEVQDEGNLTISVFDKNPKKAADIVNYMIVKLNEINTALSVTNAKANREFIEKRYVENVADINNLENDMKSFQEKYGVIAVPEQIESTIKSMSEIFAEQAKKEIEFNVLKRSYGENNPLTKNAEIEVQEISKKINSLISSGNSVDGSNLLIPFKRAPALGNKYLKIYRDIEIQYKILEFVQPLYEQAKVEEVRNSPSVLVLDKAAPPQLKAKPKGSLYALVAFVVSIVIGYFIVYIFVLFRKIKLSDPVSYSFITETLTKDFSRLRKK
jgi:tyrosine-protein kinase Etk/Wzc